MLLSSNSNLKLSYLGFDGKQLKITEQLPTLDGQTIRVPKIREHISMTTIQDKYLGFFTSEKGDAASISENMFEYLEER